jgi:hypothetical protein
MRHETTGMRGVLKSPSWDYEERRSTMSSCDCKPSLLSPTRWFAIICAVASAVNLHEELTTLVATKMLLASYLNSMFRYSPEHTSYIGKMTTSIFS